MMDPEPTPDEIRRREKRLQELAASYPETCQWDGCDETIRMTHPEDPPLCPDHESEMVDGWMKMHRRQKT